MVLDSGATDTYVDPALTPGLLAKMRDVQHLRVPHTIVAAGQHLLQGAATWTVCGVVVDNRRQELPVSFRVIVVPGLGASLLSVTAAMLKGVATMFEPGDPRLEKDGVAVPMEELGVDQSTGKIMYSIRVTFEGETGDRTALGDAPDGFALRAESATFFGESQRGFHRDSLHRASAVAGCWWIRRSCLHLRQP